MSTCSLIDCSQRAERKCLKCTRYYCKQNIQEFAEKYGTSDRFECCHYVGCFRCDVCLDEPMKKITRLETEDLYSIALQELGVTHKEFVEKTMKQLKQC
jgi:hypothetical protein